MNLRRYVGNGVTNATDPSGLEDWNRYRLQSLDTRMCHSNSNNSGLSNDLKKRLGGDPKNLADGLKQLASPPPTPTVIDPLQKMADSARRMLARPTCMMCHDNPAVMQGNFDALAPEYQLWAGAWLGANNYRQAQNRLWSLPRDHFVGFSGGAALSAANALNPQAYLDSIQFVQNLIQDYDETSLQFKKSILDNPFRAYGATIGPIVTIPIARTIFGPVQRLSSQIVNNAQRRAYLKTKFGHPDDINEVVNTAFARRAEAAIRQWYKEEFPKLSGNQRSRITTIDAVYDQRYGTYSVRHNSKIRPDKIAPELKDSYTNCAEVHGANDLLLAGSKFNDLRFVQPMSPDRFTGGLIPKEFCNECISTFFYNLIESPVYHQNPRPMLGSGGIFYP